MDTSKVFNQGKCDTIVKYNLYDISSEGTEVEACYLKKNIQKAVIIIYGASGRVEIYYMFLNDLIEVEECTYKYLKPLPEVKSDNDIKFENIIKYKISRKGKIIEGRSEHAEKIYKSFVEAIPLKI